MEPGPVPAGKWDPAAACDSPAPHALHPPPYIPPPTSPDNPDTHEPGTSQAIVPNTPSHGHGTARAPRAANVGPRSPEDCPPKLPVG
ncbi:hypothetical protein E4U43_006058, partial [Claviceps pusilla]